MNQPIKHRELLFREFLRKAFHVTGSLIPVAYYFLNKETVVLLLSLINAVLLIIEWLRIKGKIKIPEKLLRPHENGHVAAYIYFQMAALISILVFDKTIAIAALLMLVFGDTASGIAGAIIRGGNIRHSNNRASIKPFPIMAVIFFVCFMIGILLSSMPLGEDMVYFPLPVYVAGAIGATIGDSVPLRFMGRAIDDNLLIPLLSGVFMTIAVTLLV
ncbi:MAG: hypothetical protein FIB08_08290 [Candidatus Methanoperedens sp.]|nr:hypothetical protein [Candidatus Methanoperedens sp.]